MKIMDATTNRNSIKRAIACEWVFQVLVSTRQKLEKMTHVQRKQPAFIGFSHGLYLHPITIFCWERNLSRNLKHWYYNFTYNECYVSKGQEIFSRKYFQLLKYCSSRVSVVLRKSWTKVFWWVDTMNNILMLSCR